LSAFSSPNKFTAPSPFFRGTPITAPDRPFGSARRDGGVAARCRGPFLATLVLATASATCAVAQEQRSQSPQNAREVEKFERQRELDVLRSDLERRKAAETKLKLEIDAIKADRKKFSQALLDTAARIKTTEERITAAEGRLPTLDAREATLRRSLESRRAVLGEVLAAVARLSRRPAPAVVLQPEDALTSVRSAILLNAVVPELRSEAEVLVADLTELSRIRLELVTERDSLRDNRTYLEEERARLAALVEERQRRQSEGEKALESERARALALAKQVDSVGELVARMEKEIETAARAAEAAATASAFNDPARISPAIAFAQAKGRLPLPVAGTRVREFGAPDGSGGTQKGISLATRAGAQVAAPCDGWVVYAGPFRSYGRLLIINAGGGYHVLLAGMEQFTVDLGQFVLTGEPVAVMGSGSKMASAAAVTASQPLLYIEFRKDGTSIDPGPWWAETDSEKARG
jgi:murein hydrolase activator